MIEHEGNTLRFRLEDDPTTGILALEGLAPFVVAVGCFYRSFRVMQYFEEAAPKPDFLDDPYLAAWFDNPFLAAIRLQSGELPPPGEEVIQVANWIGGLTIQWAEPGTLTGLIGAFGKGAGEGIAAAVKGVADAVIIILTAPATFRERWEEAKGTAADTRIKEAEALARERGLEREDWAWKVMRGAIESKPQERVSAAEVLVQTGRTSREGADRMLASWERASTMIGDLGRAGHVRVDGATAA